MPYVHRELRNPGRLIAIYATHIVAFAALGMIAITMFIIRMAFVSFATGTVDSIDAGDAFAIGSFFASAIAAGVGMVVGPFIVALTYRKPLPSIIKWVYGTTALIVAGYALIISPIAIDSAIPAVICTLAAAGIVRVYLPDISGDPTICARCGYKREGIGDRACPECGLLPTPNVTA
ncbi:MAG: hypothetical protein AAF432_12475 [Planctomycetota bacterium]